MLQDCPSRTAREVAILRAVHQKADKPLLFQDALAERILGSDATALLDSYLSVAVSSSKLRAMIVVRSVIAEVAIKEAVARGVTQLAILGAGLDTFAYRNHDSQLSVFEVDHPATQAWKLDQLHQTKITVPDSVKYVPIDLERDDLFASLTSAGLDRGKSTLFTMLGVVPYVNRGSILATLSTIGSTYAKGTEVVFDYSEPYECAPPPIKAAFEAMTRRSAEMGEPWVSFFDPADICRELWACGLQEVDDLDQIRINRAYFSGRDDGLAATPLVHVVRARSV